MTFITYRNPCTETRADVTVVASFVQAKSFSQMHPGLIAMEVEAENIGEAHMAAFAEYQAAREEYLSSVVGDIY